MSATPLPSCDVAVIGGGIVGLATARELLRGAPGLRVAVVEKEPAVALHQSSHNSGVIHSGVYYPTGSRKAGLCVAGARAMNAFCKQESLPLRRCGKTIVATRSAELPRLSEIHRRGMANGVVGLRLFGSAELRVLQPHVAGIGGLHIPDVAITDFAAVARRCAEHIHNAGGAILTNAEFLGARPTAAGAQVETRAGDFFARRVLNCSGLHADRVWQRCGGTPYVRILPFRGEFYELAAPIASGIAGLVYPVPDPRFPFLGVHVTPCLDGRVEAGPTAVLAGTREGYAPHHWSWRDAAHLAQYPGFWRMAARYGGTGCRELYRAHRRSAFARALRVLLPELRSDDVRPGRSGVRAQVVLRDGRLMDDFLIVREGIFVHALNLPSPAATAAFGIAEVLAGELQEGM